MCIPHDLRSAGPVGPVGDLHTPWGGSKEEEQYYVKSFNNHNSAIRFAALQENSLQT